jgi:hypothetical protein
MRRLVLVVTVVFKNVDKRFAVQLHETCLTEPTVALAHMQVARGMLAGHVGVTAAMYCCY